MQSLHDESCHFLLKISQRKSSAIIGCAGGRALLLMGLILSLLPGCSGSDGLVPPSYSPEGMAQEAMAEYDTNHDGYLDAKELEHCPALKGSFSSIDQDGDHRLSSDEIVGRIRIYQESQVALKRVTRKVLLDGRPLHGATVTFVPEKFMASALKSASGVTDQTGDVTVIAEGEKLPGAQPGLYRVQVSKKTANGQETIPARYNQDTILGTEVYPRRKRTDRRAPATRVSDDEAGIFRLSSKTK